MIELDKKGKPVKPKEPKPSDFPRETSTANFDSKFVVAYKKYKSDMLLYERFMKIYEQTKFIEDIKRSSLKLCLEKYTITKQ